jgi:predicted NBD/HSP70 family sugar kinase
MVNQFMDNQTLDSKKAGLSNESLFLRLIRQHQQISQTQLCRLAGLGSSTASTIVARLREKDLLEESLGESSKRGPKPVLLSLKSTGQYLLGVEPNRKYVHIGLYDNHMQNVDSIHIPMAGAPSFQEYVDVITEQVQAILYRNEVTEDKVLGLGISVSGSVANDGTVLISSTLGWRNAPLSDRLGLRLSFPIHVYTSRVRLHAEMTFESDRQYRNVVLFNVGEGVGASVMLDGHLLHGESNNVGEIGHSTVDPEGPMCGCGRRGCLEALINEAAMARRIEQEIPAESELFASRGGALGNGNGTRDALDIWSQSIKREEPWALQIFSDYSEQMLNALATLINLYDPELVILAGSVNFAVQTPLLEVVDARLAQMVYNWESRNVVIRFSRCGDDRQVLGASIGVLKSNRQLP